MNRSLRSKSEAPEGPTRPASLLTLSAKATTLGRALLICVVWLLCYYIKVWIVYIILHNRYFEYSIEYWNTFQFSNEYSKYLHEKLLTNHIHSLISNSTCMQFQFRVCGRLCQSSLVSPLDYTSYRRRDALLFKMPSKSSVTDISIG